VFLRFYCEEDMTASITVKTILKNEIRARTQWSSQLSHVCHIISTLGDIPVHSGVHVTHNVIA
jgi:hypothetical protein